MKESLPYSTRNRLDENPHSFTNKQEYGYAATWLKETTVSDMMAGKPKFDSTGDRVDRRVHDRDQAMAEAYAAKQYMDIATKYFELIKQDSGDIESTTDEYVETWDGKRFFAGELPAWVADYDGLGALITMGKDAAYDAGKEGLVGPSPWQNDFLKYMSSQVDVYEKVLAGPEELFNTLGNKDSARAFVDSVVSDLNNQKATAKTAQERQALYKKIQDVEGYGLKVTDPDTYARLYDVPGYLGDYPGNDVVQYQRQLQLLEESGETTEVAKNRKAVIQEELDKAKEAMAENTRRNKEEISALAVFEDYITASSKPVPSAETNSRDEDVRRQREAIDRLFLGSKKQKEQSGTSSKEAASMPETRAKDIVPDDPLERQRFAREFFVPENMSPENAPVLVEFLKKSLIFEGNEIAALQQRDGVSIRYPGRIQTLTGRNVDAEYEKRIGAGTFLYELLKDKIKLPSGDRYKYIDFSLVRIDDVFKGLGVDVREIMPDYDKKFSA